MMTRLGNGCFEREEGRSVAGGLQQLGRVRGWPNDAARRWVVVTEHEPAISVEGLEKRFGEVEALAGIDFEVAPGSVFGLLGPNGAGKTTAVRILTTIWQPDG